MDRDTCAPSAARPDQADYRMGVARGAHQPASRHWRAHGVANWCASAAAFANQQQRPVERGGAGMEPDARRCLEAPRGFQVQPEQLPRHLPPGQSSLAAPLRQSDHRVSVAIRPPIELRDVGREIGGAVVRTKN